MKTYKYLLIDDDLEEHELFQIALVDIGEPFQHTTIVNGLEALNSLRSDKAFIPDFIFLDLNIPFVDGRECLMEIRKLPHLAETPVVIYSMSYDEQEVDELQSLGASHYMRKPRRLGVLVKVLTLLLSNENLPFLLNKV